MEDLQTALFELQPPVNAQQLETELTSYPGISEISVSQGSLLSIQYDAGLLDTSDLRMFIETSGGVLVSTVAVGTTLTGEECQWPQEEKRLTRIVYIQGMTCQVCIHLYIYPSI